MKAASRTVFKPLWVVLVAFFFLSGCALTNSVKNGSLEQGVYSSSQSEFSLSVPVDAVVHDGKQPLGGWVSLRNLAPPTIEQGVAYYRVALPNNKLSLKEAKGIIQAGHDDWLKNYALRETGHILHKEWIEKDGSTFYFTVIEGSNPGLLVRPGSYTGAISFIRGNYSYVLYEIIDAPYQLKGGEDSAETKSVKNVETRRNTIHRYLNSIKFNQSDLIKFPME